MRSGQVSTGKGLTRVFSFRIGHSEWQKVLQAASGLRATPKSVVLEALHAYLEEKLKKFVVTTEIRTPSGSLKVSRWGGPTEISFSVSGSLLSRFSGIAKGKRVTDQAFQAAVAAMAEALTEQADA